MPFLLTDNLTQVLEWATLNNTIISIGVKLTRVAIQAEASATTQSTMSEAVLASAIGATKVVTRLATTNTSTQMVTASTLFSLWKLLLKVKLLKKV